MKDQGLRSYMKFCLDIAKKKVLVLLGVSTAIKYCYQALQTLKECILKPMLKSLVILHYNPRPPITLTSLTGGRCQMQHHNGRFSHFITRFTQSQEASSQHYLSNIGAITDSSEQW